MSPLTKIFVVLLVVLSLVLSAATVTFVNTVDANAKALADARIRLDAATSEKNEAYASRDAAIASYEARLAEAANQARALSDTIASLERTIASKDADLAQARLDLTLARTDVNKLSTAAAAAVAMSEELRQITADLRSANDALRKENGELNVALTEKINELDVTETARRVLAEQLAEARRSNERFASALKDRGVDPANLTATGVAAGAPRIDGIIRSKLTIANIPHATISLGAEDGVKEGMEFNILDATNNRFLGKLTIVRVEVGAAVGRLTGPSLDAIAPGDVVRTQL